MKKHMVRLRAGVVSAAMMMALLSLGSCELVNDLLGTGGTRYVDFEISPSSPEVAIGESLQIEVLGDPGDGNYVPVGDEVTVTLQVPDNQYLNFDEATNTVTGVQFGSVGATCSVDYPSGSTSFSFTIRVVRGGEPGATLTYPDGDLITTEDGSSFEVALVLEAPTTTIVTIPITILESDGQSSSDEATLSTDRLSFTSDNWDVPQTVTITGADDTETDGPTGYLVEFGPTDSNEYEYDNLQIAPVHTLLATNLDNEDPVPGFTVVPMGIETTEDGGTDTFTVALNTEPTADVSIDITSEAPDEVSVAPGSLVFSPEDWDSPKTVTVAGVSDFASDGDQTVTISLASAVSSDSNYNGIDPPDVSVTNRDNGDTISSGTLTVTVNEPSAEDSSRLFVTAFDPFSYELIATSSTSDVFSSGSAVATLRSVDANGQPSGGAHVFAGGDVILSVSIDLDDSDTIEPGESGLITTEQVNGNTYITYETSELETLVAHPLTVTGSSVSDGAVLAGFWRVEGSPVASSPGDALDYAFSGSAPPPAGFLGFSMQFFEVFSAGDAATNLHRPLPAGTYDLSVLIDLDNNGASNGDLLFHLDGVAFDGSGTDVTDSVSGADTLTGYAGILVEETAPLETSESDLVTQVLFTIRLLTQPASTVTIPLSSTDTTEGELSSSSESLTFNTSGWSTPKSVYLRGVDDDVVDGNQQYTIEIGPASSSDSDYDGMTAEDITITNIDDDEAGFTFSVPDPMVLIEESYGNSFSLRLNAQPTADVTVSFAIDDTSEALFDDGGLGSQYTSVTFTDQNWDSYQNVQLDSVDDNLIDGDQTIAISVDPISSADPAYSGIDPDDLSATVEDNDTAGLSFEGTDDLRTDEEGGTDSFTFQLRAIPTADVTVGISTSDPGEATVSPTSLTIAPEDWDVPQTVTLTGVDDDIDDETQLFDVVFAPLSSADPHFDGAGGFTVSARNSDYTDTAGITVTQIDPVYLDEAGTISSTVEVVLDTMPTADVSLSVSTTNPDESVIAPSSLTFTPSEWDTPQTLEVTGVDDEIDDGNTYSDLVFSAATSTDPKYDGWDSYDFGLSGYLRYYTEDNDTADVVLQTDGGSTVDEAGSTLTLLVSLATEPVSNVYVRVESDDTSEGTVSPDGPGLPVDLTFTDADWNTPQEVTLTGRDDDIDDGDVTYEVTASVIGSSDPAFDHTGDSVSVTTTDDDTAGVTITPAGGFTVAEPDGSTSFDVVLDTRPVSGGFNRKVRLLFEAKIGSSSISNQSDEITVTSYRDFYSHNWSDPQTVHIGVIDDLVSDGDQIAWIHVDIDTSFTDISVYDDLAGTFSPIEVTVSDNEDQTIVSSTPATSLQAVDLDEDGDIDLLGGNPISWWENDGAGGFTEHTIDVSVVPFNWAGQHGLQAYAADIDGDSDLDIVAGDNDSVLIWLENNGSESFTSHSVATGYDVSSVYAADVDQDGNMDLLSTEVNEDEIAWWENNGSESFTEHIIETNLVNATDVHAVDIDGDTEIDIVGISTYNDKLRMWTNDGSESFSEVGSGYPLGGLGGLVVSDIDQDGDPDLILSGFSRILRVNDGAGTFTDSTIDSDGGHFTAVGDFNGDGDRDLARGFDNTDEAVTDIDWLANDGSGGYASTAAGIASDIYSIDALVSIDVDGDGTDEIVGSNTSDGIAYWRIP